VERSRRSDSVLIQELADILRNYDDLPSERNETNRIAERYYGPREKWRCVVCSRSTAGGVRRIEASHITPLLEGGKTTPENLILLCVGTVHISTALRKVLDRFSSWVGKAKVRHKSPSFAKALNKFGEDTKSVGCHHLLDYGFFTRNMVRNVPRKPGSLENLRQLRSNALRIPLDRLDTDFSPAAARSRRINRLKREVKRLYGLTGRNSKFDQWFQKSCELISAARRPASEEYLKIAQDQCHELQRFLHEHIDSISPSLLSWFYYEQALVCAVQQTPDINAAICALAESMDYARKAHDEQRWAMSGIEKVHMSILAENALTTQRYQELLEEQERYLQTILSKDPEGKAPNTMRWKMNAMMHRARLQIKANRIDQAALSLMEARAFRDNLNVSTGWTEHQAIYLNSIEGMIAARRGDYEHSLRLLSRALIPMHPKKGKRPETFKDIALCAAWVLRQMGRIKDADRVADIAERTIDGRSGVWVGPS